MKIFSCEEASYKYESIFLIILVLGFFLFCKFANDYVGLKKKCLILEKRLDQCNEQLFEYREQIGYQEKLIDSLYQNKSELNQEIICLQFERDEFLTNPSSWILENYECYNWEVTSYSPSVDETDLTPFINASGQYVNDFDIAVSQNMRKDGWDFGKFVYIPDHDRFYKIADVMAKRFTRRVDIFTWDKADAINFGFCDLDIYLIDKKGLIK